MSILEYIYGRIVRGIIAFVNIVTLAHRDWPYHDSHNDTMTAAYQTYRVGQNNMGLSGDQTKFFVSKSPLIYATQDFYTKLNHANNVVTTRLANTWYTLQSNIYQIHYAYVDTEGTIYIECEGVLAQEARRPE